MNLAQASNAFDRRMGTYRGFWCVAGGWAIDLFLGRQSREHEDLEVVVLRRDYKILFEQLARFKPQTILSGENPVFKPWLGEEIDSSVIQMRLEPVEREIDFDLLLTPSEVEDWLCRREESVRRPLAEVALRAPGGLPVLAPEIVMLFKAKYVREKDTADFLLVRDHLSGAAKRWLRANLELVHPGHDWIEKI